MSAQPKKLLRLVAAQPQTADVLAQGLVELHKAVKGSGFYPEGHPYRTETLQRAFEVLQGFVAERELVLTVNRQGFLLDGEPLQGSAMVLQLARDCFIRRIASITFMRDLLLCDLETFVQLLSCDAQKTAALRELSRQLENTGGTVWINEKDLAVIWAKRGGAGAGASAAEDLEDGFADLVLPAGAAPDAAVKLGVDELLSLMALEKEDGRYQELGRELAERIAGGAGGVAILPVLEELLRQHQDLQKSLPQREYALFILKQLADGAAELLLDLLESREFQEKEAIHRVLAALGGRGAYWIIQRICLAQGLFERKALATALVALGPPAIAPLIAMLKDERWYVVRNMVSIIGELRSSECLIALKRPLYHQDVRVRKEVIRALMRISGEQAEAMLIPLLEERDEGLLRHAVLALGLMRSSQAAPTLLRLLERRDLLLNGLEVKKELLVALGRIGDRRATGPLLRMLGSHGWPVVSRWLELKVAVATALGALGDEAALLPLSKLAAGSGALAEACSEALDAIERLSGGIND